MYTGTIKLKQSWLDQFEDANSADSKILSGNIVQAVSVQLNIATGLLPVGKNTGKLSI